MLELEMLILQPKEVYTCFIIFKECTKLLHHWCAASAVFVPNLCQGGFYFVSVQSLPKENS